MPRNNNIRTLYLGVHLGNPQSFEIRASESASDTPSGCKFTGQGLGPGDLDFLIEILHKIEVAYGPSSPVSLCLNGLEIKRDSECS
jgi:hypothetical protein